MILTKRLPGATYPGDQAGLVCSDGELAGKGHLGPQTVFREDTLMRRFLTASGVALLAVALLLTGTPAQAGSLSWEDDTGEPETAAQGTLDITKVTLDFDGATFFMTLDMADLGDPAPFGTGQYYAVRFNYRDDVFTFRLTQDRLTGDTFTFQQRSGESQVTTLVCKTCKAELDVEAKQVRMQVGMESLKSAMRKLGPGEKIEALTALTGASYAEPSRAVFPGGTFLWGVSQDSAPAPDPATFTF